MVNNTNLYYDILNQLRTKVEVDELDSGIDTILSGLFQVAIPTEVLIGKLPHDPIREAIERVILARDPSLTNREMLRDFFIELKEELTKLKIFELTLAFEPKEKTIERLFTWVQSNFGEGIVLKLRVDKEILGGAVIVWNGIYKDGSLKTKLEEVFKEQKAQILKLVT